MSLAPAPLLAQPPARRSGARVLLREDFQNAPSAAPPKWEEIRFPGVATPSRYRLVPEGLFATAQAGASSLARAFSFEPCPASRLHWSWRVSQVPAGSGTPGKKGDDYAARVAVIFAYDPALYSLWERTLRLWRQRQAGRELPGTTIEYVWNGRRPPGAMWPNPYTNKATMVAVGGEPGRWNEYERDLCTDYRRAFGRAPPRGMGLFLMTDADDTGGTAAATYRWIELRAGAKDPEPAPHPPEAPRRPGRPGGLTEK